MQWSREAMLRNECQFDSFAKKVMRNFARNWFRKRQWRSTKKLLFLNCRLVPSRNPYIQIGTKVRICTFFTILDSLLELKMMHWRGRYVLSRRVSAKLCCCPIFAD